MSLKLINRVATITISLLLLATPVLKAQSDMRNYGVNNDRVVLPQDSLVLSQDSVILVKDSVFNILDIPILNRLQTIDSITLARIIVVNNTRVQLLKKKDVKVKSYRIRLYFDNSQNARAKSLEIEKSFKLDFPDEPIYLNYITPYFHVTAGHFLTYQEALAFLRKLSRNFPKAFVVPDESLVTNFGSKNVTDSLINI